MRQRLISLDKSTLPKRSLCIPECGTIYFRRRPSETIMATEEERAVALIRDHVVPLIEAKGEAQAVGPTSQMMWEAGSFRFALRTPSSPNPVREGSPDYSEALAEKNASGMLPYGLDIWHNEKVLSLQWDADKLAVMSFKRGPWEEEVLALH
jgi:hypothetical protein